MSTEIDDIRNKLVVQHFDFEEGVETQKLVELLQQELVRLILHDSERLWNILYRIDVNEQKVKQLFTHGKPIEIAPQLARMILERLEQKAITRIQYRK